MRLSVHPCTWIWMVVALALLVRLPAAENTVAGLVARSGAWTHCQQEAPRPRYLVDRTDGEWVILQIGNDAEDRFDTWDWIRVSVERGVIERWDPMEDDYVDDDVLDERMAANESGSDGRESGGHTVVSVVIGTGPLEWSLIVMTCLAISFGVWRVIARSRQR